MLFDVLVDEIPVFEGGFSMTINVERDYELVVLEISGRLDATTAPNLEKLINKLSEDKNEIVFNMSNLEYMSSAGIRVLLKTYKKISTAGSMRIMGENDLVREALETTGLSQMIR